LRDLLEGAVFAEREAHLQILERRYKPGSRYGDPAPLRELLAGVQALVEDARRIEREVGLRALTGGDGATSDADFRVLERTVADRLRRLVESAEPATSIGIVGVYGREGVDELVTLYTSVGESVGLRVEARPLMIQGSGLHLYDPANPTIEALGDRVGVELRVTGSGAQLLYRGEEGVTLFQRPGGDARVRVLLVPTDRAGWERARPGNVHRKQFFSEPPRRVVGATVEDRDTRAWAPDLAAVGARIVATFTNRLFEALA
jgi:hypothetical protein